MSDLKDQYQERAEEIAQEEYEMGFYDLPQDVRDVVYERAMHEVVDGYCDMADNLRKAEREK